MRFVVTPGDTRRELNRLVRPRRLSLEIVLLFTVSPGVGSGMNFIHLRTRLPIAFGPLFLVAVIATHTYIALVSHAQTDRRRRTYNREEAHPGRVIIKRVTLE